MESKKIFNFTDYRAYLASTINEGLFGTRGPRSAMADAAGCQLAYLSQVLGHKASLSLEQASGISDYLNHDEDERSFFFDMILMGRAGTRDVESFYKRRLEQAREAWLNLAKRVGTRSKISNEDRATYYGAWYIAAIHMLVHIPKLRTAPALAERLGLPLPTVQTSLDFLVSIKAIEPRGQTYAPLESNLHLPADSPFLAKHLYNWRVKAMLAADQQRRTSLHYSSVMTLNAADSLKIRELMTEAIARSRDITAASTQEVSAFAINMDFFEL